ncbi:RluA family pseudouridine synthase [Jannaschia sp. LMIT008]|uniref:RluA family pseudouridine synthase n=1 Tax=Jannaschia maritima TaxID=3032585 RepID=UPI0028128228|nr:RluA family pseudouridine synthase [Jannaschia sp. LMIT008]
MPPRHSEGYDPPTGPIPVVHRDADLLVVDKPAGLLSVPGRGAHLADSLLTRLQESEPEVLLCHRLDRDTSGVMVFALTKAGQRGMGRLFETRKVAKRYVARVHGRVAEAKGTVDLPLIVDWENRPLQHVDHERGKPAVTDWKVLESKDSETRMRLMPRTGRSHQLRVHMQAIGHPILGDPFYATPGMPHMERLMLHAEGLKFAHPVTEKVMRFTVPAQF